jgi:hypothetical protein
MVIRNFTSRYSPFEEDDDEEEENENDEDFPTPTPPPSSPVLTSQQSQASKYCELDKFTKQWENYQIKRNQYLERKKNRQKRKRIDESEEQRHARRQNANNSQRIRKNQFTKEQLQLFRLQKRISKDEEISLFISTIHCQSNQKFRICLSKITFN